VRGTCSRRKAQCSMERTGGTANHAGTGRVGHGRLLGRVRIGATLFIRIVSPPRSQRPQRATDSRRGRESQEQKYAKPPCCHGLALRGIEGSLCVLGALCCSTGVYPRPKIASRRNVGKFSSAKPPRVRGPTPARPAVWRGPAARYTWPERPPVCEATARAVGPSRAPRHCRRDPAGTRLR
jgi:hypothetical protein